MRADNIPRNVGRRIHLQWIKAELQRASVVFGVLS